MLGESGNEKSKNALIIIFFIGTLFGAFFYRDQISKNFLGSFPLSYQPLEKNYPLIRDRSTCEEAGGAWERREGSSLNYCVYYYSDGGTRCTNSSECEGVCVIEDYVDKDEPVVGKCLPSSILYGCFSEIGRYRETGAISCIN